MTLAMGTRIRRRRGEDTRGNRSDLIKSGSKNKYSSQPDSHGVQKNPAGSHLAKKASVRKIGTQYNLPDVPAPAGW